MPDEDYEFLPYKELTDLKKQLKQAKSSGNTDELVTSLNILTKNMDNMLSIFKQASQEMEDEVKEENVIAKNIKPLMEKVETVIDQNKTIAEGMVTIADMVKDFINKFEKENMVPLDEPPEPDEDDNNQSHDDFGSFPPPGAGATIPSQGSARMSPPPMNANFSKAPLIPPMGAMSPPPSRPLPPLNPPNSAGNMPMPNNNISNMPPPPKKKKGLFSL